MRPGQHQRHERPPIPSTALLWVAHLVHPPATGLSPIHGLNRFDFVKVPQWPARPRCVLSHLPHSSNVPAQRISTSRFRTRPAPEPCQSVPQATTPTRGRGRRDLGKHPDFSIFPQGRRAEQGYRAWRLAGRPRERQALGLGLPAIAAVAQLFDQLAGACKLRFELGDAGRRVSRSRRAAWCGIRRFLFRRKGAVQLTSII